MSLISYENIIDPILRNVRQIIPEFAGMKSGDEVLDVCCGTGAQVIEYSRHGIAATGIDIEHGMLHVALHNKEKLNLVNASFCLADATSLPFDANRFDYVSVCFGLHDKERDIRNRIVTEMKRVVKPDGSRLLQISVFLYPEIYGLCLPGLSNSLLAVRIIGALKILSVQGGLKRY
jgi:ubiquinone/menaquinone biosynthesis C-methylase UbiE